MQGVNLRVVGTPTFSQPIFGVRGEISTFSRASQRRYIEWFNRLEPDAILSSWFITLTYPDEVIPDSKKFKRDLDVFFRRLQRKFPHMALLWKAELEDRKSGTFVGTLVPHVHCLLVARPQNLALQTFRDYCARQWFEVVGSNATKHLNAGTSVIQAYGQIRSVVRYVAKYTSKLISPAEAKRFGWKGRWWGIVGRRNLPLAEEITVTLQDRAAIHFRRLVRKWLASQRSGLRYSKMIALKPESFGFNVWGLPAETAKRMVIHATQLANMELESSSTVS